MNESLYAIVTITIVALSSAAVYRVAIARTVFDRLLAAGAIGTNAIALLAVTGFLFERPDMFVDLALAYGLLNFVGTVAVGKYLEAHPSSGDEENA